MARGGGGLGRDKRGRLGGGLGQVAVDGRRLVALQQQRVDVLTVMRVQGVGSLALDGRIGNCFAMLVGLLVTAYGTIERNREIGTREKGAGKRKETRVDRMPVGRASGRERSIERKKRRERGSRDNRPAQCDNSSDIPFCLFLMLVKLCNRAGSRGAKGWRLRVAIVSGWGGGLCSFSTRHKDTTKQDGMGRLLPSELRASLSSADRKKHRAEREGLCQTAQRAGARGERHS